MTDAATDPTLDGIQCRFVTCTDDMFELKRWAGERRPVLGIDTETAGFDWWRQELRMIQLGDAMTGWAIPWDDWKGVAKEIVQAYTGPIAFHNMKFDLNYLERNELHTPRAQIHDTEVLVHLDNSSMPKSLKAAATRMIHRGFAGGLQALDDAMTNEGWDWGNIPIDHPGYWSYAALDPVMTARLWEKLQHLTALPIYDIEIAATQVLERMEQRGVRIDVDYCETKRLELRAYTHELRAWAKETYGVKNLTSDAQVREVLLASGWEPTVFTAGGAPSLRKEVVQWIEHPLAQAFVACKHATKMAGTYLDNFLAFADGDLIHAKINPLGARTGRMSITDPALQTLPREDYVIRDCFIPRDGRRLISCDYDQIEMRMLAHFANSEGMRRVFASGDDIFTWMAQSIFQDTTITKKDARRQITKSAAYAKGYGAGAEKFSETAGIDTGQASAFYRSYDATFPELVQLARDVEAVANDRQQSEGQAYVVSPYGRRHVLGRGDGAYKLVNYLTQGTAADIFKRKLVEMAAAGLDEYLVLPIHDEFILDVPADAVAQAQETINRVMPEMSFSVPITVGIDVIDRWGEKYR